MNSTKATRLFIKHIIKQIIKFRVGLDDNNNKYRLFHHQILQTMFT
jgi:hypothetical protein